MGQQRINWHGLRSKEAYPCGGQTHHHSKDKPAIDTNYAAHLPILDLMFGSFHMPKEHWPKEYGTLTRLPRTFVAQFMYPFRSAKRPKDE